MGYDFSKREQTFRRIVFALSLNHKKLTERIVIGEASEARRRLDSETGEVYYDQVRSLGQFLIDFEADPDRKWNVNAMFLRESYGKILPGKGALKPAADFLREQYDRGEPTAMYAAIRTWEEHVRCYNLDHGPDRFLDAVSLLYRPFFLYDQHRPWQEEAGKALSQTLHDGESQVELWYPVAKRPFECVVAYSSFQPVIFYALYKIEEWGFVFQKCKVCGKYFLAKSKHYELCSDACRKVQAVEAKRQFDERTRGDRLEQLYDSTYFYWYNRMRALKRAKAAPEKVAAVEEAFKAFRAEAIRQKGDVKRGEMKLEVFSSWLVKQQDIIDRLTK